MIALGLSTHAHFMGNVKSLFENGALPGALLSVPPIGLPSRVHQDRHTSTYLFGLMAMALVAARIFTMTICGHHR